MDLIKSHKWSVSCSYDILKADDKGGSENNIKYGMEILDGIFTHLALVKNPRYERANIVFNSKTVIINDADFESKHSRDEKGRFSTQSNQGSTETKKSNLKQKYSEIIKTEKYKNLPEKLKEAVDFVFKNEPVASLTGDEFQKDGVPLTEKVTEYYSKNYPNGVNNSELGNVKLDKEGVKDSLGHGIGSLKAAAYMAVPNVIEKGYIYDKQTNWKNRGYDTAVLIAPIKINGENYACEVVVKKGKERQGFYLHEVEITNKLADVFKTANGSTPTSSNLIIADKINKLNPNVKNDKQSFEEAFTDVFFEALAEVLLETYK